MFKKLRFRRWCNVWRVVTAAGFIIASVLILCTPLHLPDPDDWAYYNGVRNISDGRFTVDNMTIFRQTQEITEEGGWLIQYFPVDFNKWALEKAPGVVFYLVPFYKIGLPRVSNVVLALGMVIVTYLLLRRLHGEKAAMFGSFLILFTPIAMVMFNRIYMDTYASLAFLSIGGGLYLYYHLERSSITLVKGSLLLFVAFFFIAWSVISRYTNVPIAVILVLHLAVTRFMDWRRGNPPVLLKEIVPVVISTALPAAALLLYNNHVFGSPLSHGYSLSPYPIKFAFQYLGQVDDAGKSISLQILNYNLHGFARNLLIGFPLLAIGIPGFCFILYHKIAARFSSRQPGETAGILSWDVLLVLVGWFIAVFGLYLAYEWTAGLLKGGGFVLFDRFLLPGLFPVVIITALIMACFPLKLSLPLLAIFVIFGTLIYAQWALDLNILPYWMTERTLETHWPGYIFPPWTNSPFNP